MIVLNKVHVNLSQLRLGINHPLYQLTARFEVLKYAGDFLPTPQLLMHQSYTPEDCNNGNDQHLIILNYYILQDRGVNISSF